MSRKKNSDFEDLEFLFRTYGSTIREWSAYLSEEGRREFYEVYKASVSDKKIRKDMKRTLGLD